MRYINLGCGEDYREGWMNVDRNGRFRPEADRGGEFVLHDLEETPWPFEDNQFERALADDVLEHIDPRRRPDFVSEVRRIVEPGGVFINKLPTHSGWDLSHYDVPQWYWPEHPRHEGQWDIERIDLRNNKISRVLPKRVTLSLLKYDAVWAARGVELHLR